MTWSSSSPSVATVDSNGVVTAIADGTTTITSYYTYSGAVYTDTITIEVFNKSTVVGIENGRDYYIMNYSSKRLMGLETAANANFTNVHTGARTENSRYQWKTDMYSDGTFKFVSVYSSTNRCLDVTDGNVDIYTDNNGPYLKFTIERVTSGDYAGYYLIKHDSQYVAQESNYNVCVTDTLSPACYWSFMAVQKGYAEFFCLEYSIEGENEPFQTSRNYSYFRNVFNNSGYFSWSYIGNTPTAAYNCMTSRDEIFVYAGHGSNGMIAFIDTQGVVKGSISVNSWVYTGDDRKYISSIQDNGLNHARMVIYLGCNTGAPYVRSSLSEYNLVDDTFDKGAHFVLGVTKIICNNHMNDWLKYFLDELATGANIENSILEANMRTGTISVDLNNNQVLESNEIYTEMPLHTIGDKLQYLDIS